jgi:CheY-like chemotaxis protein
MYFWIPWRCRRSRYLPAGLEVDLFVPEPHIAMAEASALAAANPAAAGRDASPEIKPLPLAGMSVLLLEDNFIIALEGASILRDLGAALVHTASSIARAESILAKEHLDFALLDINIGRHTSLEFADSIGRAGIPFVFASGYGDEANLGGLHQATVTVTKPYTAETLAAALRSRPAVRKTTE